VLHPGRELGDVLLDGLAPADLQLRGRQGSLQ
jgi:hypothetical protein